MFFKMRSAYFVAALSTVLSVAAVASAKYKAQDAKIQVHAKGPAGMKIEGKSSKLVIDEDDKTVTFKTFLNTIDTDNGQRNKHMQERFEADKHPDIKLTIDKDKIDAGKGGTAPGTLNFHGVSKKVEVKYSVKGKHVHASFDFDVTNHGVDKEKLCAFSVCAKTDVGVEVDFDLKD
jgi:polyisoprenoid-binding protein YceI